MTNVAYELGNQLREKLISSNNISSISYESLGQPSIELKCFMYAIYFISWLKAT